MSNDALFCRDQAIQQRAHAADAVLTNVRERCERAASTWEAMAARAERTEKLRAQRQAGASPAMQFAEGSPVSE